MTCIDTIRILKDRIDKIQYDYDVFYPENR